MTTNIFLPLLSECEEIKVKLTYSNLGGAALLNVGPDYWNVIWGKKRSFFSIANHFCIYRILNSIYNNEIHKTRTY